MYGQRQRSGGERRRSRRRRGAGRPAPNEPVVIAARRPNAPLLDLPSGRRKPIASARPSGKAGTGHHEAEGQPTKQSESPRTVIRRSARIVELKSNSADDVERQRQRLLDRLIAAQGRIDISRAFREYIQAGFECPVEQEVQLQLLEHIDEARVRDAISALGELLGIEPPTKKTLLEHRLRRLEEYAEEAATRRAASELRRALREVPELKQARM